MEIENKNIIRIGITGHRNLTGSQCEALEPAVKRAIENIIYYNQVTDTRPPFVVFTSPLAIGADTLFANVVIKYFLGELKVYLPFEKNEYLKDFETQEQTDEFERLINDSKVKEIVYLNNLTEATRDELYLKVGEKVVEDNDYIIAIWDEEKANGTGGTGDVVNYAKHLKKNVLVINPNDEQLIIKGQYLTKPDTAENQPEPPIINNNIVASYFKYYDDKAVKNQKAYKKTWMLCFKIGWLGPALILSIKVAHDFNETMQFIFTVLEVTCLAVIGILIWIEKRKMLDENYLMYRFIAERLRINNLIYSCG
jgi:hypothetical protein